MPTYYLLCRGDPRMVPRSFASFFRNAEDANRFGKLFRGLPISEQTVSISAYVITYEKLLLTLQGLLLDGKAGREYELDGNKKRTDYGEAATYLADLILTHFESLVTKKLLKSKDIQFLCPFLSLSLSMVVAIFYAVQSRTTLKTRSTIPILTAYIAKQTDADTSTDTGNGALFCVDEHVNQPRLGKNAEFVSVGAAVPVSQVRFNLLVPRWTTLCTESFASYLVGSSFRQDKPRQWFRQLVSGFISHISKPVIQRIAKDRNVSVAVAETKVVFYLDLTYYRRYFPVTKKKPFDKIELPEHVLIRIDKYYSTAREDINAMKDRILKTSWSLSNAEFSKEMEQACSLKDMYLVIMHPHSIDLQLNLQLLPE